LPKSVAVEVNQVQFREHGKELVVLCASNPYGSAPENGIATKHQAARFKQKSVRIDVGFSRVI